MSRMILIGGSYEMGDVLPVLEDIESFLSVLMNLLHPMAPAKFISQLSLSFQIFACLLDYFSFIFILVAFCTISLAFFYLQMSLICCSQHMYRQYSGFVSISSILDPFWFDFSKLLP